MDLLISILSTLFKLTIFLCVFQTYGDGSGADCRRHVQKLNLLQGQISEMSLRYSCLRRAWLSYPALCLPRAVSGSIRWRNPLDFHMVISSPEWSSH